VNGAAQVPLARAEQCVRAPPAGVAEGVQPATLPAHHHGALPGQIAGEEIPRRAQFRFVPE
jgi:hypothetical protein